MLYLDNHQAILIEWNLKQITWEEITVDLCHPNSLTTIENWAKT